MFTISQMTARYAVLTITVFSNLKYGLKNVLNWFQVNSLKASPSKFWFIILGDRQKSSFVLNIDCKNVNSSSEVKLVGIVINSQLKFKTHWKSSLNSQFNYAALIWMFSGKTGISKICKILCRQGLVVYNKYQKFYDQLLKIYKDISILQKRRRL